MDLTTTAACPINSQTSTSSGPPQRCNSVRSSPRLPSLSDTNATSMGVGIGQLVATESDGSEHQGWTQLKSSRSSERKHLNQTKPK